MKKMERPEENTKCELAKINHTDLVIRRMSQLLMSNIASDVVFIVEGQRLSAHKCIFAAGNKYFEELLYGELSDPKQEEFELKEVPLEAFRAILGYIYSGQMCFLDMEDHILDILRLAQKYNFEELQHAIIKYLEQIIAVSNAWPIFELAWLCDMEDLKNICYTFMDRNASNLLAHESFNQISKKILEDVLRRDSFLAPEFEIFTAVSGWCKHHEEVDVDSVLSYVRLPLISLDELLKLRRAGVLKEEQFIDALEMKTALKKPPYRVWPSKNMATLKFGATIIGGSWTPNPPPGNIFPHKEKEGDKIDTPAVIEAVNYEAIVVGLGITSIINHIEIELNGKVNFSYFVEVAPKLSEWERIADYRDCNCTNRQTLYFPPKFVKYIKIVGTGIAGLKIISLVASYEITMPKQINGFITATIEISGLIKEAGIGIEYKGALFNVDPYNRNHYHRDRCNILRVLPQPYLVGSLRIFFSDFLDYSYDYSIQVSVNEKDWWTVKTGQNENATSWLNISFPPRPVLCIKISSSRIFTDSYDFNICFEEVGNDDGDDSKSNK